MQVSTLIILLTPAVAAGFTVVNETFESDWANFTENTAWDSGYCLDAWRSDKSNGVMAGRDDGCEQCGCNFEVWTQGSDVCVYSDPFDNHITVGDKYWQNYVYTVSFRNADDDTLGVVFRYSNTANYYLFALSRGDMPGLNSCDENFGGARLYRISQGEATLLKEDPFWIYSLNKTHNIRVTVMGTHIKVEFDENADGAFEQGEVFFEQHDKSQDAHLTGRIGLYAFQNGIQGVPGETAPCANKQCWFDNAAVDLLPPENEACGDVSFQGKCAGNTLVWCDLAGESVAFPCGEGSCCKWVSSENLYTCAPDNQCMGCVDDCQPDDTGCSSNLTHSLSCGQGDDDACLEPVFTLCDPGYICDPAAGQCISSCVGNCAGKECGPDGCGGECGACEFPEECVDTDCEVVNPGGVGDPCSVGAQCASSLCLVTEAGKICTISCVGQVVCPPGYQCEDIPIETGSLEACMPSGECASACSSKQCGDDGCGGSCGTCPADLECSAGLCKHKSGQDCDASVECASGLCIHFQTGTMCSTPCSTDEGCLPGWACTPWLSPQTPHVCAPKSTMQAYSECQELGACLTSCPNDNEGCLAACFFLGSPEAQKTYAAIHNCLQLYCSYCGDDMECGNSCTMESCFQSYADCYPGTTSCQETLECTKNCEPDADLCPQACFDSAMAGAKLQFLDLFACIEQFCGEDTGDACFSSAAAGPCGEEFNSCVTKCEPVCDDKLCGNDGCGDVCGECLSGEQCYDGICQQFCTTKCNGKDCGPDGCGGVCGECLDDLVCVAGKCEIKAVCLPKTHSKCVGDSLYWFDSCGNQEELQEACGASGCDDDHCTGTEADGAEGKDAGGPGDSDTTGFDAKKPGKEGCSGTPSAPASGASALLLMGLLAAGLLARRLRSALTSGTTAILLIGLLASCSGADKAGEGGSCSESSDCKSGLACVAGTCAPSSGAGSCMVDAQCAPGYVCLGGKCSPADIQCLDDGGCDDGFACQDYKCVPVSSSDCEKDDDCEGDLVCQDGACIEGGGTTCEKDDECDEGEVCVDGKCKTDDPAPECASDEECESGLCDTGLGECIENPQDCGEDADCDDGAQCTTDQCVNGKCKNEHVTTDDCCVLDTDCAAAETCQKPTCIDFSCTYEQIEDCCLDDFECEDGNPLTEDTCVDFQCQHNLSQCVNDASCNDGNPNTIDSCVEGQCINTELGNCVTDQECIDANPCTNEKCVLTTCEYEPVTIAECECVTDQDCAGNKGGACSAFQLDPLTIVTYCTNSSGPKKGGELCTEDMQCKSAYCVPLDPPLCFGGCKSDLDCFGGSVCGEISFGLSDEVTLNIPACVLPSSECKGDKDCPPDEVCHLALSAEQPGQLATVCIPDAGSGGKKGGQTCGGDDECKSDTCFELFEKNTDICWATCETDQDCEPNFFCYPNLVYFVFNQDTPQPADDEYFGVSSCTPYLGTFTTCQSDADCPGSEFCNPYQNSSLTALDPRCVVPFSGGAQPAGAACTANAQCKSDYCVNPNPNGFCFGFCKGNVDCSSPTTCQAYENWLVNDFGDGDPGNDIVVTVDICLP